jgi:hypothetical protein
VSEGIILRSHQELAIRDHCAYIGHFPNIRLAFGINGNTAASIAMTASRFSSNMCQHGTLGQGYFGRAFVSGRLFGMTSHP